MAFLRRLAHLRADDRGVTSVEYALIGVLILAVVAVAVGLLGQTLLDAYTSYQWP